MDFSMDKVVQILTEKYGIYASVSMTGGGVATIYAGEMYLDAEGCERYPAVAGPGSFAWKAEEDSTASTYEFFIGSDDNGESAPWDAEMLGTEPWRRPTIEEEMAFYIYAQTFVDPIVKAISEDMFGGVQPVDVPDFSTLHDYVDANEYLMDTNVPFGSDTYADGTEVGIDLTAYVQELVDLRIKAGDFRRKVGGRAGHEPCESSHDYRMAGCDQHDGWSRKGLPECNHCGQAIFYCGERETYHHIDPSLDCFLIRAEEVSA